MKNLFLSVIFIFAARYSYGQYGVYLSLTFDSSVTGSQVFSYGVTQYFNYSPFIYIDTLDYPNNQWQIGKPQKTVFDSAYSYPNALITDTLHACRPNDTSVCILKIPRNIWAGFMEFSFVYKLDIDSGDIALMEWSADTGINHWTNILTDTNGLFSFYEMPGDTAPSLSYSNTGWDSMTLTPYSFVWYTAAVDTFMIRFTLITDSSTAPRDGWMMDNFVMAYQGEGITIVPNKISMSFHPNPVSDILYLHAGGKINSVSICDLLGNVFFKRTYNSMSVEINVADLAPGMYFMKVNDQVTDKFIKQ